MLSAVPLSPCPSSRRWVEFISEDPPLRFKAPILDERLSDVNRLNLREGDYRGVAFLSDSTYCRIGEWSAAGERLGGATKDFSDATEREVRFNYRWYQRDGKTYVEQGGSKELVYEVEPLDILTADGARAVIFRASSMSPFYLDGTPEEREDEIVAVVNFPPGYDARFASLTIHLMHRATIAQLRQAIRSLEFVRIPRTRAERS